MHVFYHLLFIYLLSFPELVTVSTTCMYKHIYIYIRIRNTIAENKSPLGDLNAHQIPIRQLHAWMDSLVSR